MRAIARIVSFYQYGLERWYLRLWRGTTAIGAAPRGNYLKRSELPLGMLAPSA